jgi:putative exporter of polyketide antibiotics
MCSYHMGSATNPSLCSLPSQVRIRYGFISKGFFALHTLTSLNVLCHSFAHSLQYVYDGNVYQRNTPTIVGQSLVVVWACYMTLGITFACIGVLSAMTPMSLCM